MAGNGELKKHLCLVHLQHPVGHFLPGHRSADVVEHRAAFMEGGPKFHLFDKSNEIATWCTINTCICPRTAPRARREYRLLAEERLGFHPVLLLQTRTAGTGSHRVPTRRGCPRVPICIAIGLFEWVQYRAGTPEQAHGSVRASSPIAQFLKNRARTSENWVRDLFHSQFVTCFRRILGSIP